MYVVFDMEGALGIVVLPTLFRDDALRLRDAVRCGGMRSEVALKTLNRKLRERPLSPIG